MSYEPIVVGASWTYLDTDPVTMAMATKTTTVEAYEDIGAALGHAGKTAYRVNAGKIGGVTVSWEGTRGPRSSATRRRTSCRTARRSSTPSRRIRIA
jgi:hypothetical protein